MKKYNLMEISKLSTFDIVLSLFMYVLPLMMFIQENLLLTQVIISGFILLNITFIYSKYVKRKVNVQHPRLYLGFLLSTLIYLVSLLVGSLFYETIIGGTALVISVFAMLYSGGIILFYIGNSIFIFVLKGMFPKHSKVTQKEYLPTLNKLSGFIDLHTQKVYLSLVLLDAFLYLVFVGFCVMLFLKYVDAGDMYVMSTLSNWAKQYESIFAIFNAVALLSLLLTIYSKTFSVRRRIQLIAYRRMKKRFKS